MNTKQSNREKYPEIAEFVDRLRDVFGDVKVIKVVDKTEHEAEDNAMLSGTETEPTTKRDA